MSNTGRERRLNTNHLPNLEPCPFPNCRGEAMAVEVKINDAFYKAVRCKKCGMIGPHYLNNDPKAAKNAITLWNDRGSK